MLKDNLMVKLKESQKVEFKASFGKEVIISLVAFANAQGGKVIIGMADDGRVTGVDIGPETLQRYLNEIKTATYPQLIPNTDVSEIDGKTVVVFEINEYPVKPVSYKNRYYKRVKNSNHLLTLDEIVDLQQQGLNISYDAYPLNERLSSLDIKLIERFVNNVNSRGRINLKDDLVTNVTKLKLIRNDKPTLAAMLLFGDHGYSIHIGRFKSEETIIDDVLIKDPLIVAIEDVMLFIKKHITLAYEFNGGLERKEKWEYPLEAIRELLLNAVVHRDYKQASDIVIKIFDGRIIFTSPGKLYGGLKVEDLARDDYVSSIRNKLLAEAFYLMGDIEKYGTGFIRIRQQLLDYPDTSFHLSEVGDSFRVEMLKTTQKTTQKKPLREQILQLIGENPKISQRETAVTLGLSFNTVKEYFTMLKKEKRIKRLGGRKEGHWEVLE